MKINKNTVLEIEKQTKCPILEIFYTHEDNYWYACFEEDTVIKGKNQTVHLNDVLNEIEKYDNIEYLTNECYEGNEKDSWFEQITFQWKQEHENIN